MTPVTSKIERVEFVIEDNRTVCNLLYSRSDKDFIKWGQGWKTRIFPADLSVSQIISFIPGYTNWKDGRTDAEVYLSLN